MTTERVQLPSTVVPTHYDLTIDTNLSGSYDFQADVKISITLGTAGLPVCTAQPRATVCVACAPLPAFLRATCLFSDWRR